MGIWALVAGPTVKLPDCLRKAYTDYDVRLLVYGRMI